MDRPGERLAVILLLFFILSSAQATSLIQALQNAGASQFAAQIQADPDAAAIYFSNRVQTVFAPTDAATNTSTSKLRRRQSSPAALQMLLYHSTANTNTLASMSTGSGLAMMSNDISPQLGGKSQVFVSTPLGNPKPNSCANMQLVNLHYWSTIFVPTFIYIKVPPVTIFIKEPVTVFITINDTDLTTVHDTDFITVSATETTTVHDTDYITIPTTEVTTVHDTDLITVETTDLITVPTTEITTLSTIVEGTKPITVPTTFLSTILSTVPTTVFSTQLSTVPITVLVTVPTTVSTAIVTTMFATVSTEVPTTIISTVSTEELSAILSIVSTQVPTTIPTTVSTEVSTTVLSTVSTTVQITERVTVPTTIVTTDLTTVSTEVPTTVSTVVTTRLLPTATPSLVKISSGLGNSVNVIQADIPYDGGIIHVIDNSFTLPESLTDTANANGQTAFTGLASSYNLTDTLDNTPDITYFIPSNGAFAMQDATNSYSSIENLLLGHMIPNFAGYLPSFTDGATYTSQANTQFTVSINGSDYYINNAKVILANVILENGVAHVIDEVIQPSSTPTQVPFPSSSSSLRGGALHVIIVAWTFVLFLFGALLI